MSKKSKGKTKKKNKKDYLEIQKHKKGIILFTFEADRLHNKAELSYY